MQIQELEAQSSGLPARAEAHVITTAEEYIAAGEMLKEIRAIRAQIDETFDPIISKAHLAHKEAIAQKKRHEDPLARAEDILRPRIARYMQEQERIRQQEQLRLEKEERERQERDRLENAAALDSIGETAAANRLLNEPPPPPPPVILPRSTPKVPGIAMTTRYSARVVDMKALLGAILAGKAPMMAVSANMVFLNQQARSMKETLQYPGVVVDKDNGISARRS